jgi:two-component system chemotaxis sensor kinase CheA
MAKYRAVFVEEATEHLAEISRALLELEKDPSHADAIDRIFRMAHSIKGMAGSLEYPTVTELAHRLEDRMQAIRGAGRLPGGTKLSLLFRGLSGLERMVASCATPGRRPAGRAGARLAPLRSPGDGLKSSSPPRS